MMRKNNTVLILEDENDKMEDLFDELEREDFSEFDVLQDEKAQASPRRRLHTRRHSHAVEFERVFEKMILQDTRFPVLITDMKMPSDDGEWDANRGLQTALFVRSLDSKISIIVVSARLDVNEDEICSTIGGKAYFMRRPYDVGEFVGLVIRLVDEWNQEV